MPEVRRVAVVSTPTKAASEAPGALSGGAAGRRGVQSKGAAPGGPGVPGPTGPGGGVRHAPSGPGAASGEPSGLLQGFRALSPLRAPQRFNALNAAMVRSLSRRREAEAPPSAEFRPAPASLAGRRTAPAAPGQMPTAAARGRPSPTVSGETSAPVAPPHEHAGTAPQVPGAQETITELEQIPDSDEARLRAYLRQWQAGFFGRLPEADTGVSTDPGPGPRVSLSGPADPAQIAAMNGDGRAQLEAEARRQALAREQDFGENDIAPELEPETLRRPVPSGERPGEPRCPLAEQIEPYRFDAQDETELSGRVRPRLDGEYDAELKRLGDAERARDGRIQQAREEGERDVAGRHAAAHQAQLRLIASGRAQVARHRQQWQERDEAALVEFDAEVEPEGRSVSRGVQERVGREQGEIECRRGAVREQAVTAKRDAERESAKIKREGRRESGSWLSRAGRWIKDQVKRLASWVSEKISRLFDALRTRIKQWFDDFKAWALDKIERVRRWVIDRLEDLRGWLHEKVDQYLGRYPAVARVFKRGIDATIDVAQKGVNATAEGLKRGVNWVVDSVATLVDGALALVEGAAQIALWGVCNLAVLGVNLVVLAVEQDIEALIELIRDLPEPAVLGPLWPAIKYALLGYLERLRDKPADEKKRYERKTRELITSLSYYGGVFLGVIKGFVWDGLVGLVTMLYDIVTGIPQALSAMFDYFRRRLEDVEAIEAMAAEARALWGELRGFLARPDSVEQIIAYVKRAPRVFLAMVREVNRQVRGWAYGAGVKAADRLYAFVLNNSPFDIGLSVGTVVGRILFEIALLVLTSGAGTLVKWGGKALQVLAKAGRWLTSATKGGAAILRALGALQRILVKGVRMAQRIGRSLRGVFVRLERLIQRVVAWFKGGLAKLRRRRAGSLGRRRAARQAARRAGRPDTEDLAWREFVASVRAVGRSYGREGVRRAILRSRVRELVRAHRRVVSRIFFITEDAPHWNIRAKRKGLLHVPRRVGRAYMDRQARWKAGKRAIRRAARRLRGYYGVSELEAAILPIRRRFGYTQLDVGFDREENLFEVRGAMSPLKSITKLVPPTPPTRVAPTTYRAGLPTMHADPLSAKGPRGTPTTDSVNPRHFNSVRLIRSRSGTKSLYIKGHLLSAGAHGSGHDPDNLTWITRSLNARMFWRFERSIKRGIAGVRPKRLRRVFNYKVEALPGAKPRPRRRWIHGQWIRIPDERRLAKVLRITLMRKLYEPTQRRWVDDSGSMRRSDMHNVPPYPRGYKEGS